MPVDDSESDHDSFLRAAAKVEMPEEDLAGKELAQYRIGARLGQGGMGVVYRANDTALRRTVALKVLPRDLVADAERRRRFLREARLAAATTHPNVAAVYEVGEAEGRVFLVMELVEGETLRARIEKGRLESREAARIGAAIAMGLSRAHDVGIVHRDLKPDNVMLTTEGGVKILDFGVAKLRDTSLISGDSNTVSAVSTQEGRILGTPAYMSPEQAKGRSVDEKSDIFSLGVVLYEMATGIRPFRGDTPMEVLIAIDRDRPTPPSKVAPIPEAFERVILWCLEKDAAKRPKSSDVGLALAGLEAAQDEERNLSRWAAIVAIGIAVTTGTVGLTLSNASPVTAPIEAAAPPGSTSAPEPIASAPPPATAATVTDATDASVAIVDASKKTPAATSVPRVPSATTPEAAAPPPNDLFHNLATDAPF